MSIDTMDQNKLEQIKKAAADLTARGEKVTTRAVQAMGVKGDTGVIARAIKALKADADQAQDIAGIKLPDDLSAYLLKVLRVERQAGSASRQSDVDEAVTEMVEALTAQDVAEARAAEVEREKAITHSENGKLTARLERAALDLSAAQDAARISHDRATEAEARIVRVEVATDIATRQSAEQIAALKAQIEVLSSELGKAREAERIAQERAAVAESKIQKTVKKNVRTE